MQMKRDHWLGRVGTSQKFQTIQNSKWDLKRIECVEEFGYKQADTNVDSDMNQARDIDDVVDARSESVAGSGREGVRSDCGRFGMCKLNGEPEPGDSKAGIRSIDEHPSEHLTVAGSLQLVSSGGLAGDECKVSRDPKGSRARIITSDEHILVDPMVP